MMRIVGEGGGKVEALKPVDSLVVSKTISPLFLVSEPLQA